MDLVLQPAAEVDLAHHPAVALVLLAADLVLQLQVAHALHLVLAEMDQTLTETVEHPAPALDVPHLLPLFLVLLLLPHVLQL
jgi:hypothetical protein